MKKATRLTTSLVAGTAEYDWYYSMNERQRGFAVQQALRVYHQLVTSGQISMFGPVEGVALAQSPQSAAVPAPQPVAIPIAPDVSMPQAAPVVAATVVPVVPQPTVRSAPVAQVVVLEESAELQKPAAPAAPAGPPEITKDLFADFY